MQIEQDDFVPNNYQSRKSSGNKTVAIVVGLIIFSIILMIGIILGILFLKEDKLKVLVDGTKVNYGEDTFIFTENGKIYVSIRDVAPLVKYESHNGEYKEDIEDTSKMYVEAIDETETASFYANSNIISKVKPNTTDDYINISIIDPVIVRDNGKMYISTEGFTVAFNSLINYDQEKNTITIQTLPSLIKQYSATVTQYGYTSLSTDFNNQKALIYGMMIAQKGENEKYGVINISGNEIISPRYNKIEFLESSKEFIITNSSEKVGIAFNTGKNKINVAYDEIKLIDSSLGLYLVKSGNKYGVIDSSERFIVHAEHDKIGIETKDFPADNIKNQYILGGTIIPTKLNNKWTLYDTKGNRITDEQYDGIGFVNQKIKDKVVNNAVVIEDTGVVVVSKDGKYGGIDAKGNELVQLMFDGVYSITSEGKTTYYVLFNGIEYNAIEYINAMKERLGYKMEAEIQDDKASQENTGNTITVNKGNNTNTESNQNNTNTANNQDNTNTEGNQNNTNTADNSNNNVNVNEQDTSSNSENSNNEASDTNTANTNDENTANVVE